MDAPFRRLTPSELDSRYPRRHAGRVLLALLLLFPVGQASAAACRIQEVYHYSSAEAAETACRSFDKATCVALWGQPREFTAADGHSYYSATRSCWTWHHNSYEFHFPVPTYRISAPTGPPVGGDPECSGAGNPVDVASGNKFQQEVDLVAAGPSRLAFGRYYNSRVEGAPGSALGGHWRHRYTRRLQTLPLTGLPPRSGAPTVTSSSYDTRAAACEQGWKEIRGQTAWPQADAEFDGEACTVGSGARTLTLSIAQNENRLPYPEGAPMRVRLHRADGGVVDFVRDGQGWTAVAAGNGRLERTGTGRWVYTADGGTEEVYGEQGRLLTLRAPYGSAEHLHYDDTGRLVSVEDDFGRALAFEYDGEGNLIALVDPTGQRYRYRYDASGRLATVVYPDDTPALITDNPRRSYHYEDYRHPGALTGITDARGARFATWEYDAQGRAVVSTHAGGAGRTTLDYVGDNATRVTNPLGRETTYHFATIAEARRITGMEGHATVECPAASRHITHNDQGQATSRTDWKGETTTYTHNASGLETRRTEAAGTAVARTVRTTWDVGYPLPRSVTEGDRRIEYTYDSHRRLRTKTVVDLTSGRRATTAYTYHPDSNGVPGRLAAINGPRTDVADVTRFAYDADGNRVRVTNALGHVTRITAHDAAGRAREVVGPNGLTTRLRYDARGRLIEHDAGGRITRLRYDAAGNLTRLTRPDGSYLIHEYDAAQRVIAIEDEQGHRIEYELDAQGNRTAVYTSNQGGQLVREHQQVFDALGRLIERIGARSQTTRHEYDANGNRTRITDPAEDATRRAFDALDRLIRQTDAADGVTRYAYDDNDRITAVTDPNGNTTRYTYDGLGHRTRVDSPDAGVTTYAYDAAGNVIAETDARGQTTIYRYDALNRRTAATYADGTSVTFDGTRPRTGSAAWPASPSQAVSPPGATTATVT